MQLMCQHVVSPAGDRPSVYRIAASQNTGYKMARVPAVIKKIYRYKTSSWEKLLNIAIHVFCLECKDTDKRIRIKGNRLKTA